MAQITPAFEKQFRPLTLADKPVFDQALRAQPPEISEYTFTNLYTWRRRYGFEFALWEDLLLLRSRAGSGYAYWPPLGRGEAKTALQQLLEATGCPCIRVPEAVKDGFQASAEVHAELDRDNSDYVYRASDLIDLKGRRFDGKRNLLHKFKTAYAYDYVTLNPENARQSLSVEELWCLEKNCDEVPGLDFEREAIREMVDYFALFQLRGGAIRVDGKLCALAVAEALNPDTLVMHILKALPDMPGLYPTMHREFLAREAKDFTWVNLEQDLGLPGLRQSKESYQPARMILKYTLSWKT